MLTDSQSLGSESMKMAEHCQPDYETMIARSNKRLGKELKLRDALLEYLRGKTVDGKLAELVGEIVTRCNNLRHETDGLIKRQKEKDYPYTPGSTTSPLPRESDLYGDKAEVTWTAGC